MLARIAYEQNSVFRLKALDEFVHLSCGSERRFIEHVKSLLAGIRLFAPSQMPLQSRCLNSRLCQLLCSARSGRKTFDSVAFRHCAFANYGEGRRFACAGHAFKADNLLARKEYLIDRVIL